MPLQVRRGTETQRTAMVEPLASGELLYVTTTGTLYIGNGNTLGGIAVANITEPGVKNIAGAMFTGGTHTGGISFVYDGNNVNATLDIELSNYQGTIRADAFEGSVFPDDSSLGGEPLVDAIRASINLNGTVKGNIVPDSDSAYDIGSSGLKFRDLYLSGTSLHLGNAVITASGGVVQLPAGSTVGGVAIGTGTGTGTGDGVIEGSSYRINIVSSDGSSIMLNNDTEVIAASGGFVGPLTGNVLGNVTGDVTGDITGNGFLTNISTNIDGAFTITARATVGGNSVVLDVVPGDGINVYTDLTMAAGTTLDLTDVIVTLPTLQSTLTGNVTGNVTGNLTGNVTGNLSGIVSGPVFTSSIASADSSTINIGSNVGFRNNITVEDHLIFDGKVADLGDGIETSAVVEVFVSSTNDSNLKVLENGPLYLHSIQAHNGTGFVDAAALAFTTEGTITTGATSIPTTLRVLLGNGTDDLETTPGQFSFNNTGAFIAPIVQTGSYTSTARDLLTPAFGMMIYNTTTNTFQGYQNTGGATPQWVNLS